MRHLVQNSPGHRVDPIALAHRAQSMVVVAGLAMTVAAQVWGEESAPRYEAVIRASQPGDDDPQQTLIDRDQMERSPARSVAEVLEREAGIHTTSGSRGERIFTIRGFEQRQVFMVIDGVPAYIPYDGQLDLGKIPVELVESVVVLRGPSSLRYGPGGMGGTLSIQTRTPGEGPLLSSRFDGGRGRHQRLSVLHSHRVGRVAYLLGGGVESRAQYPLSHRFTPTDSEDGGEREQSDRLLRHLVGRVRVSLSPGSWIEATTWHVSGAWGTPPNIVSSTPRYWRINDWRATVSTVGHRWMPARGVMMQELVFVGLFDNLLDSYDDATYSTQEGADAFHSWYHDLTAGGWSRLRWAMAPGVLLRVELGARYEQHQAERGGAITSDVSRVLILGALQLESYLSRSFRLVAALQSEGETALAESVTPSFDTMIALRYEPDSPFSIGFSVARRSRIPTLRERFSQATGTASGRLANPDLRHEEALHLGVDAAFQPTEWLRIEAMAFEAEVRDLIDRVWLGEELDQFQNIARARLAGVELGLELAPLDWLGLEIAYQYLYARSLDDHGEPGPLSYRPAHMARFALRLRPIRRLEISSVLRVVGPQEFDDAELHVWRTLGTYVAWDARIEAEPIDTVRLWLQVTNLLDANYQTQYGYPEPGWQIWGGVRLVIPRRREAGR